MAAQEPGIREALEGRMIHIVGPHLLSSEALGNMITAKTGAQCECVKTFDDIIGHESDGPELFLWDCLGKDLDTFMTEFMETAEEYASKDFVALFNLRPGQGIEENCVGMGVRGVFYQDVSADLFIKGVCAIYNQELWFSREWMSKFILDDRPDENPTMKARKILTHREIEILSLLAVGCKNEEIADKLCVSPHTIKTHLYNIYKKINVSNRLQATLWAAKNL